ncbi:MAG: patatin-like phospholipase family protein [Nonlabens sp.]
MENNQKLNKDPIRLGLVLAGAVTAGAFTAGVIDYLLNTLRLWHKAYEENPGDVPEPNVIIDVMTGASAGGITAAVTTLGLTIDQLEPVTTTTGREEARRNVLFDTWVNFGKKRGESIVDDLFSLEDLEGDEIHSLLNTTFINNLMEKLIATTHATMQYKQERKSQGAALRVLPPYINPQLEILMTLSNLRGIPIDLYFTENKSKVAHTMQYHKAYAHFEIGKDVLPHKLPLDFSDPTHLQLFLDVARASGAFPIGLKSVPFKGIPKEYIVENIKRLFGNNKNLAPLIDESYSFLATDGGMINNEPIAEALKILKEKGDNYKLLLIDPFPGRVGEPQDHQYDVEKDNIFEVVPQLFSTLRNQVLFKENDIMDLFEEGTHKNMIWPTRYGKNREPMPNAIACGALSGFAGFMKRDFRYHDYMLGQKNAQNFLRYYFHSANDLDRWSQQDIDLRGLISKKTGKLVMPIIPDYSVERREKGAYGIDFIPALHNDPYFPTFPSIDYNSELKRMEGLLEKRVKKVVKIAFKEFKKPSNNKDSLHPIIKQRRKKFFLSKWSGWVSRKLGNGFMSILGINKITKTVTNTIMETIIRSLSDYGLLK